MDPVSHLALGRTLLELARRPEHPQHGALAAVLLGALSPDIDAVIMPFGWDRYLRAHEIGTHTVVGTAACALATACLVRLLTRNSSYRTLAIAAWIGAASHVLLDLVSGARLRPGWPVFDTVVSLPMVAMADPWFGALCVAGAAAVWMSPRPRKRRAAGVVAAVTVLFLLTKAGLALLALSAYRHARDGHGDAAQERIVQAEWASLDLWRISDRSASHVRSWSASALGGAADTLSYRVEADTPIVAASRSLSTVRNFLHVHTLGFAVTIAQADGRRLVLWSDIRFCRTTATPAIVPMPEPTIVSVDGTRFACALWSGGEFDANGRPLREIVKVGGLTQVRQPAR